MKGGMGRMALVVAYEEKRRTRDTSVTVSVQNVRIGGHEDVRTYRCVPTGDLSIPYMPVEAASCMLQILCTNETGCRTFQGWGCQGPHR